MIVKYVLKNFRRRKVRTVLMVLSLIVSTGLIVAMSATVETVRRSNIDIVASATGRFDLSVRRSEISPEPFIPLDQTIPAILAADPRITAVSPRFNSEVELSAGGSQAKGILLALDPAEEIGQVEVISGTYSLGDMQAAVLEATALTMGGLQPGDVIDVAYSFPQPRQKGSASPLGGSQRRAVGRFTISGIVRQNGVTSSQTTSGLIISLQDAQDVLGLPNQAEELVALVDPALYEAGNSERAALSVREVALNVQEALGESFVYRLEKAQSLDQSAQAFLMLQALITTYGLMSLGVVGLLVYTLVMTNVQEQRREMAVLRILGSQRSLLFEIVIVEVLVIGLLGVGLGILLGQVITSALVVPFIESQVSQAGLVLTLKPVVSLSSFLPAVVSALLVLLLSAIRPAQDAAHTKVIHAINPGAADNLQLEDLEKLRERSPNIKLFFIGWGLMGVVLIIMGMNMASLFGNPAIEATIFLIAVLLMVLGLVFVFFIFTRPLERLILLGAGLLAPRLVYFAKRNVGRGAERNTLISLMVLFSGVLPSFLATQSAISRANIETDVRLWMGAPVEIQTGGWWSEPEFAALYRLRPSFVSQELPAVPGIDQAVGLSYEYWTNVSDPVGMRSGNISLIGVTGDLNQVLYPELVVFSAGGPQSLQAILDDPGAVVIGQGLAEALAIPLGGKIKVKGEGLDHDVLLTVAGIAQRLPGFGQIGRVRSLSLQGGTVLISLEGFRRLTSAPNQAPPPADAALISRVLATTAPGADPFEVEQALVETFGERHEIWTSLAEVQLQMANDSRVQEQVFLLVLTLISFATAVFGVFAVIYVTIYARRMEIGMLKAVGTRNWELNGMLSVESITMSLSAALAGILAGSTMGYLFALFDNAASQRPQQFAIDTTVMPFIVIMVVLASILGTIFSARRIIKRKAVEILRMS
jgi:putative ABC transport system permease protein